MFLQVGEELKEKKMKGKDRKEEAEVSENTTKGQLLLPCMYRVVKKSKGRLRDPTF